MKKYIKITVIITSIILMLCISFYSGIQYCIYNQQVTNEDNIIYSEILNEVYYYC
ncbi:MAG: hypothetical protein IJA34_00760 [Lachnospiraceae bacterium]|nr:hypothetical protein [Lachnospiraceae bacterium]